MSSAAQDEFDALVADKARPSRHPADESDASSTGSTTLAPSSVAPTTSSAKPERPSIRGSLYSTPHGDPADGDSSDEDEARPRREPSTYYLPNYYTNDNMTGPKGVIADAQAFEKEKRGSRDHTWDEQNFERTRDLALPRTQRSNFDEAKRGSSSSANNRSASSLHKTLDNKEDADWEEEDEELQRWRTNRITQLKQSNGKTNVRRKKTFGRLKMVDGMGFLEAVEKSSRGAVVVVYIWNDEVRADWLIPLPPSTFSYCRIANPLTKCLRIV